MIILIASNNVELQRLVAITFAEITEKWVDPVPFETMEPIIYLMQNPDVEVQRAAGAALSNLAVNDDNKKLIMEMNGLEPLIQQMQSLNVEVQCNAVGCMTNLATHEDNKIKIAMSGALVPLTKLATSKDIRVQRNATGALLNMTHLNENRAALVQAGAIPVLVSLLSSTDSDVQYYCATALSNIAVDPENRELFSNTEPQIVSNFVNLVKNSSSPRVRCQAVLALRNLASDPSYQEEVVRCGGLVQLLDLLKSEQEALVVAAAACLRNVSIHQSNETEIVKTGFLKPLVDLLGKFDNEEIDCHTVSTLRNLAAPSDSNKRAIVEAGVVQKCKKNILTASEVVQSEMTACLAVLALDNELKPVLFELGIVEALLPLTHSENIEIQGNSAAALSNLSSKVSNYDPIIVAWSEPFGGVEGFLTSFLQSNETTFEHISMWMILQLLDSGDKRLYNLILASPELVNGIKAIAESTNRPENHDDSLVSNKTVLALAENILGRFEQK